MTVTLRLADPERDFPRIAALLSTYESEPITIERIQQSDRRRPPGRVLRRGVACDEGGLVIGHSCVSHETWMKPSEFEVWAIVDPAARRQGIGAALFEDGLDFARGQGATRLTSEVRDNSPAGLRFAEQRGFTISRHIYESTLHLAEFDEQRFGYVLETLIAAGLCFTTIADLGNTPDTQRKLYDLNRRTALDVPGHPDTFPPFEEFMQMVCGAAWYRPDGEIVAVDGQRWAGMARVGHFKERNAMYNMFTGVDRDYRGRDLALALKLLAIRCAQRYGATYIRTNNDSHNAPMLAINRKLGYQPAPGKYRLVREL